MNRAIYVSSVLFTVCLTDSLCAKIVESSYRVPEGLVEGGAFIDRFLPVPWVGAPRSDVWGAENVIPRDADNGIEDAAYSYWGGNIIKGDDGKYHMFVCRWPEDNVKGGGKKSGHHTWWSSTVVHAVCDNPSGPYKVIAEVGAGHNPEIYRRNNGSYVVGVMGEKAYGAKTLDGPWQQIKTTFQWKNEPLNKTNRTYVPRQDGSLLMVNKNGYVFISDNGDENFRQVSNESVYPKIQNKFEDPVIWKDEVQYHLVVNDWLRRYAFYLRSPDGINWKWDPGYAYTPDVMEHPDGVREEWYKFERPKVLQDKFGRATHMNFAVIDVVKDADVANDNHSSKNIVVPLRVPRRLEILNPDAITADTKEIQLLIKAEPGFDPLKDVDVASLTLGAPEEVNFGRGCRPMHSKPVGKDLLVVFSGEGNGVAGDNFTAKLIGKTNKGGLLFGYSPLP